MLLPPPPASLRRLVGRPVRDERGAIVGDVVDVVLEPETGCIAYVVLGLAGGPKRRRDIALPWGSLRVTADGDHLVSSVPRRTLEGAARDANGPRVGVATRPRL